MKKGILLLTLVIFSTFGFTKVLAATGGSFSSADNININSYDYETMNAGGKRYFTFEVPIFKGGAYNVYSTGTDVRAYFYEKNGPFWNISYDLVDYDNNSGVGGDFYIGRTTDVDSSTSKNSDFISALDLDALENYYIKVYGDSSSTSGTYRVYVKENLDEVYNSDGGKMVPGPNHWGTTLSKTYLGKEASELMYISTLSTNQEDLNYTYLMYGFDAVVIAMSLMAGPAGPVVGVVGFTAHIFIDQVRYLSSVNTKLLQKCNITSVVVYTPEYGYVVDYNAANGIEIQDIFTTGGSFTTYYSWTNNKLVGKVRERWNYTSPEMVN